MESPRLSRLYRALSGEIHLSMVQSRYALGRDYSGMDDVLLVALTEKRTPADVDRLAAVLEEVC